MGRQSVLSLDQPLSEYESGLFPNLEIADPYGFPPDAWFDRQWALAVLEEAIATLRSEAESSCELSRFEVLQRWLVTPSSHDTAMEVARSISLLDGAFKVAVHRLRKRFRQVITERISQTDGDPVEGVRSAQCA